MWECPRCKESMHDCDDYCWNCRMKNPGLKDAPPLPAAPQAPGGAAVLPKADSAAPDMRQLMNARTKKCPFCAEDIRVEAVKCRFCGSVLPEGKRRAAPPGAGASDDARLARTALIVSLAVMALIALLAAVAYIHRAPLMKLVGFNPAARAAVSGPEGLDREVAYEEILEYDAKGNVSKTVKTYPALARKGK